MRKVLLSILFVLMVFISFSVFADTKPIICSETEDGWVNELPHQKKGAMHYFVGYSTKKKTLEEAQDAALQNALVQVSKNIGVDVSNLSIIYREKVLKRMETLRKDVAKTRGANISVRHYNIEKSCHGNINNLYNFAIKIAISDEEMKRIEITADGKTDWSFKTSRCSDQQVREMKKIFKGLADESNLNWNLQSEQTKEPIFKRVPETAFFAKVEVECDGDIMSMSVERDNLVENKNERTTPGYAKGTTFESLKADLYNKLKIYSIKLPKDKDFHEQSLPLDLLTLISDAKNFEKKWRLDPSKAKGLWQKVSEYIGDNPYKDKAQYEIDKIQKYVASISKLSAGERNFYINLKKILENPSFNTEVLCEEISKYIDLYGDFVGSDKIENKVFNMIKDNKKKEEIRKKIFSDNSRLWHEACSQGDFAKCYLYSMINDNESTIWKMEACEKEIERACFDLYSEAKKQKNRENAANYAEKSCYLGNGTACFHAAGILFTLKDINTNPYLKKSIELFGDSCLAGQSEACHMLGWIFGKGSDKERSKQFYNEACKLGEQDACHEACKLGVSETCSKK